MEERKTQEKNQTMQQKNLHSNMKIYCTLLFFITLSLISCVVKDTYYISKSSEYDIPIDEKMCFINIREYESSIQLVSWYNSNVKSKKIEFQDFKILLEDGENIKPYSVKCSGDKHITIFDTLYTKTEFNYLPNEVKYTLINNNLNKFYYNFRKFKKSKTIKVIFKSKLESESWKNDTIILNRKNNYYLSIH